MPQAEPLTLFESVDARLMALLHSLGHLGAVSSFERRQIERDLDIIEKTDARLAHLSRAVLASLDGEIDRVDYYIANARRLGAPAANADRTQLSSLVNLGFATRALHHAREVLRAGSPDVSLMFTAAMTAGGVSTVARVVEETKAASQLIASAANASVALARKAAQALVEAGRTEDEMAQMLDVAGDILRENRLLWLDRSPRIVARTQEDRADEPSGLHYFFRIDLPPIEAAGLSRELARRIIDQSVDFDELGVSFTGTSAHVAVA